MSASPVPGGPAPAADRAAVSVIVPFRGVEEDARALARALRPLELGPADELIVADNSDVAVAAASLSAPVQVVRADRERSSYHARNAGVRASSGAWLLFVDADCVPQPDLIDAYFREPIADGCAIVAGQISGDQTQPGLLPHYARTRNYLSQTEGLHGKAGVAAATANLLVRRAAFDAVGGFAEGIRSAGDVDLCWRLRDAGWTLAYRPGAGVVHRHRETLRGFLGQIARYAAGARWLDQRHPGNSPPWPLVPGLIGSARDIAVNTARGRFDEALFRAIDAVGLVAHVVGYRRSNAAAPIR